MVQEQDSSSTNHDCLRNVRYCDPISRDMSMAKKSTIITPEELYKANSKAIRLREGWFHGYVAL